MYITMYIKLAIHVHVCTSIQFVAYKYICLLCISFPVCTCTCLFVFVSLLPINEVEIGPLALWLSVKDVISTIFTLCI